MQRNLSTRSQVRIFFNVRYDLTPRDPMSLTEGKMEAAALCDIAKKPQEHWHTVGKYLRSLDIFPLRKMYLIFYVHMMFWRSKHATPTNYFLQIMACFASAGCFAWVCSPALCLLRKIGSTLLCASQLLEWVL